MMLNSRDRSSARLRQGMLLILVLLVALYFRVHDLDRVPPGLDGDEMFNGWDALRVWKGNLAVYFPANYGREPLLIYLIALATRLLGAGAWTVRLPSALCGIVGLVVTWALARRLFNRRVAILTVALMAVSLWPVLLNRIALRAGLQPVCQAVAVYALWRALHGRDTRWATAAGLFIGLNFYTYTASRIFPLVLALWLLAVLVSQRSLLRANARRLILVGLIAGLVALPLALFALRYPETFNQRVDDLNLKVIQFQEGNPEPVWRSTKATLAMFTLSGDPAWRYNPAGRPVFDWLTGPLFYLGLIVSLFRLRRPAYSLPLIWLPVMLLPTVLSIKTPSFLRSVGALTPIYLMPAIGVDFVWQRLAPYVSRLTSHASRFTFHALSLLGLILIGVDTWHDYFVAWPRHPQVLHTYEADLAAAARYLSDHAPDGTPVWVSSDYPGDLSRRLLDLQTTYSGPVRWFDGNLVTVWPSGWAGQDVLLLFTQSSPPNPDALAALGDYLVLQEDNLAGQPHLWVYRIPGEALSENPWQPSHDLGGRFAHNREVLGYDAPSQAQRQGRVPVVIYWRVPPGVAYDAQDLPRSFVCLQDRAVERCPDEVPPHFNAYPVWDWTVGDVVAQRYMVPVPAALPPQTTYFHAGMFDSRGEISFADENRAGAPLLIGPVEVTGAASVDAQWDADTPTFDQKLALISARAPAELYPGGTLEVELQWQAMREPGRDYVARLELLNRASGDVAVVMEELVGGDRHPTGRWVSGEPVRVFYRMHVPPDLGSGEFDISLTLLDAAGQPVDDSLSLGSLSISGRPHNFELPDPAYPLEADFGSRIRLLGFDLGQVEATGGGRIDVVLYWQALDVIPEDYKVFVHLYHPFIEGGLPGQHDSPPGNGEFPTSSWLPGEVVADSHRVTIEANADPGLSEIGVGLYLPATGERLPVFVDGEAQPNDVLIITEVEIQ